jgi:hypothetical protein
VGHPSHQPQQDDKKKPKPQPKPTPTPAPKPAPKPGPPSLPPCQSCRELDDAQRRAIIKDALNLFNRTVSGDPVTDNLPAVEIDTVDPQKPVPLKIIHLVPPLQGSASYQDWDKKSTQEIVDSSGKDKKDGLKVYPDGAIANGNTRITILKERGVDVDNLPRDIINKTPVPDPIEPK